MSTIYRGGENVLHNLEAEMARTHVKKVDIARLLNISTRTVYGKIHDQSKFTTSEAIKIQKTYFPELSIEYLFAETERR